PGRLPEQPRMVSSTATSLSLAPPHRTNRVHYVSPNPCTWARPNRSSGCDATGQGPAAPRGELCHVGRRGLPPLRERGCLPAEDGPQLGAEEAAGQPGEGLGGPGGQELVCRL